MLENYWLKFYKANLKSTDLKQIKNDTSYTFNLDNSQTLKKLLSIFNNDVSKLRELYSQIEVAIYENNGVQAKDIEIGKKEAKKIYEYRNRNNNEPVACIIL